jgi:hypothetical protein
MKGIMKIMCSQGDTKLIWDSNRKEEVDNAKRTFDDLTKKKYRAFAVKKGGSPGSAIDEFDPELEKIIMVPPIQGG